MCGVGKQAELGLGLLGELGLDQLPLDIGVLLAFLGFFFFEGQSSFFFEVVAVDSTFEVVAGQRLIFVVDWTSANNIEFGLVDKRQMTVSLLWFGVV